jgi:L-ascorbate metabolism protein UlaG (beta-lactamase superfamily)
MTPERLRGSAASPAGRGHTNVGLVQITHVGHSCVLVTHQHADHLDRDRLPALLERNPGARLVVEPAVAEQLGGSVARDVETLEPGATTTVAGATVTGVGGRHAVIHADIPRIGNVGLLVTGDGEPTLYHPGDMLEDVPSGVAVLAVPLSAPWCAVKETVEFVRTAAAPTAFPIHDAILSPTGRGLYQQVLKQLTPGTELRDLAGQGPVTIS